MRKSSPFAARRPCFVLTCLAAALAPASLQAGKPILRPPARPSVEPTADMLPPVDPDWARHGWKTVVPHAFVIRPLIAAREKPEAGARPVFSLRGGVRVPVLEQRKDWWKVSWTEKRSGWIPAYALHPHAWFMLIDSRTGKVLRRIAAKGERGALPHGDYLWSLSNRGMTRTSLTDPPIAWANGILPQRTASLPARATWWGARQRLLIAAAGEGKGPIHWLDPATGESAASAFTTGPGHFGFMQAQGDVLSLLQSTEKSVFRRTWNGEAGPQVVRYPGTFAGRDRSGRVLSYQGSTLTLSDSSGKRLASRRFTMPVGEASLAGDGRVASVWTSSESLQKERLEIVSGTDLKSIARRTQYFEAHEGWSPTFGLALSRGEHGLVQDDYGLQRFARGGMRAVKYPCDDDPAHVTAGLPCPDGIRYVFLDQGEFLYEYALGTGKLSRRPADWHWVSGRRRDEILEYLPQPSIDEISHISWMPDGRTLLVVAYLNGDPEG